MPADSATRLVRRLSELGQTLATAESLTGGLIGAAITEVPGASLVYRGGLITYATDLKGKLGGVSEVLLAQQGPVAEDVAIAMAEGAALACEATYGLTATGVAGPSTQSGQPVGTVFLGWFGPSGAASSRLQLSGARRDIRQATVQAALALAIQEVRALRE